jgi:hypothetical protein
MLIVRCQVNIQIVTQLYSTNGILLGEVACLIVEIWEILITALAGGETCGQATAHDTCEE